MEQLRPKKLNDIVGQEDIKACLQILLRARKNSSLPHHCYAGPPGTGKTTFATALASEVGGSVYITNGNNLEKIKDVLPYLLKLKGRDILFIDEIHAVSKNVQEFLYTVMEDFYFTFPKSIVTMKLEQFTLIGATTEAGLLLRPLYDRFEHHFQLDYYSVDDLSLIIQNSSKKLGCEINSECSRVLAKLSRFTPRIANSLLSWCNDYVKANGSRTVDKTSLERALSLKSIDNKGMDQSDRKYVGALRRAAKPLGLETICAMTGLSRNDVMYQIEPYLFKLGMIQKTPKGRVLL
jgi:holliday junction DNA helicase RuvB